MESVGLGMRAVLILLCLGLAPVMFSQVTIQGRITNVNNKAAGEVANVGVYVSGNSYMSAYTVSDEEGFYRLNYTGTVDSLLVVVSGFNLKRREKRIPNRSQALDFEVQSEHIVIKEVLVKAPKILVSGDTLSYMMAQFADASDRTIGDVLKKMPGIEVLEDGSILYQNKPINRFYIENLDLLKDRYGIATNNINPKDVASIQIFENHQPVKALQDYERSYQAALNVKLRDEAKGIVLATLQPGIGASPLLLSNELTGMYFSRNVQDIVLYKGDNSGRDITRELNSMYSLTPPASTLKLLAIPQPAAPAISLQRYLFNDAHIASVNDLRKVGRDYTVTTNIHYIYDEPERNNYALFDYYLPGDSVLRVEESIRTKQYKNRLKSSVELNTNTDNLYLNNRIQLDGEWDRENAAMVEADAIRQHLDNPVYGVSNDFRLVKSGGKNLFQLSSFSQYKDVSQTLRVAPVLYGDLFHWEMPGGEMVQRSQLKQFTSDNSFTWGRNGAVKQSYTLDFKAGIQRLQTGLNLADSMSNNLQWDNYEWKTRLFYSYDITSTLSAYFMFNIRYVLLRRQDEAAAGHTSHHLIPSPTLHIDWQITPAFSSTLFYTYDQDLSGIEDYYTGYVMRSYRSFVRNDGRQYRNQNNSLLWMLHYKNPFSTLFASLTANYLHSHSPTLSDYTYDGILRIKSALEYPNNTEHLNLGLSAGKDMEAIRSVFSVSASYNRLRSSQLSQGVISAYQSHLILLSSSLHTKVSRHIILDYKLKAAQNRTVIPENLIRLKPITTLSQHLKLHAPLKDKLIASLSVEHFYNGAVMSGSNHICFGDIRLSYTWKNIEFTIDYTNLFNTARYTSTTYSDIGKYYNVYPIRPAEILAKVRFSIR